MNKGSNDTSQFSAEDIRRYHAGEMPAHEMHAMEKAALEDPFLADAMEGYTHTTTPGKDIEELKSRLFEKQYGKIISLSQRNRTMSTSLKAAALVLLLAGAGWIVYQFSLPKENDMALNQTQELQQADSVQPVPPALTADSLDDKITAKEKESSSTASGQKTQNKKNIVSQATEKSLLQKTETAKDQNETDVASVEKSIPLPSMNRQASSGRLSDDLPDSTNIFKGRIVNAENKPVPYATINIPDLRKNVSADAQGNFFITAPDSVLRANVNAVGYQTNKLNLNNAEQNHRVVLQASEQGLQEVVVTGNSQSRRKELVNRSAISNSEVEPVDGFKKYNEYLLNNIKKQRDNNKKTIKGEVVLLFDVTDKGAPVNITIEKSLCAACDEEAIRLLKEGPKWQKKQDKKGRVIIVF